MDGRLVWLIAGLGNPGRKYSRTRHNIGFLVVEEIACRYKIDLAEKKEAYRIGRGSVAGQKFLLVEPLLFMNMSGSPLRGILRKFNVVPENFVLVHDDLDMEAGKLRIRKTGSSGGHKGVESVIQNIGSRDFVRVKIGIGREPGMPAEEYVLSKFKRHEIGAIKDAVQNAADAVGVIISEGVDAAMNRFN
jgi:PTH1 family peptidyl-tRNA hydrolase